MLKSDKQLRSYLTYFILCTFMGEEDVSGFFCYFFLLNCLHDRNFTKSIGGRSGVTTSECVDEDGYLICVRHLAISTMLRVIYEYFLVPSHFMVIVLIESFHIYKNKMRRSASPLTKVTFFPSKVMFRTENTISTSASPTLRLTVFPLDFRPSANKSIKDCLFLVLGRKAVLHVEQNSLSRFTHTSSEITTFINLLRCSWSLVDGPSKYPLKTTHFPFSDWT